MAIPRSAAFMRSLVELAGKQADVQRAIRAAATTQLFEQENKASIEDAFTRIASSARGGSVRMMLVKDDILNTQEFRTYMEQYGFLYTDGWHGEHSAIEWWFIEKPNTQRVNDLQSKQLK
jgi:hypothetical protein